MSKVLFCIVGKSGSGKTTVVNELEKAGYKSVQSYTTRPKRYENETGHTFITKLEFDKLQNIVSYTKFDDCEYCVTEKMLDNSDVFVVDYEGIKYLQKHYKNKRIVVIYLICPNKELVNRMKHRGDSDEKIRKRILNDSKMFPEKEIVNAADYVVDANNNTDYIFNKLKSIFEYEINC